MTVLPTDLLALHLQKLPRRYAIMHESGAVFEEDEDYDGLTLTIELRDEAEADAVARALRRTLPHWRPSDDTGGCDD